MRGQEGVPRFNQSVSRIVTGESPNFSIALRSNIGLNENKKATLSSSGHYWDVSTKSNEILAYDTLEKCPRSTDLPLFEGKFPSATQATDLQNCLLFCITQEEFRYKVFSKGHYQQTQNTFSL